MTNQSLFEKYLSITAAFEGASWGGSIGNFDGAGISAFILQWNLGQRTLQPLLKSMLAKDETLFRRLCGPLAIPLVEVLRSGDHNREQALVLQATLGDPFKPQKEGNYFIGGKYLKSDWKDLFSKLGETFKAEQLAAAQKYYVDAKRLFDQFEMHTERAMAFMFDQAVQRGARSLADEYTEFEENVLGFAGNDYAKLNWILEHDLPDFSERWRHDVEDRRRCIINGEGIVHGVHYNLKEQFGLSEESA